MKTATTQRAMRTVIKNKLYNTETARMMGRYTAPDEQGESLVETLHRKKNGEYFLHRVVGLETQRDKIIPLSYDDAVIWGKMSLCELDFNKAFSGAVQSGTLKVTLSQEARALLEREQSKSGQTYNEIIDRLILESL